MSKKKVQFKVRFGNWKNLVILLCTVFLVNVVLFAYLGFLVSKLEFNLDSIESNQRTLSKIQTWSKYYPWLSLGVFRLPYLEESYLLVSSASELGVQTTELIPKIEILTKNSLSGQTTEWQDWESNLNRLSFLLGQSQTELIPLLRNKRINQLATLFHQDETIVKVNNLLEVVPDVQAELSQVRPFLPNILGYEQAQHYVVLTQNNMELWPTGGYLGSYLEFWLDQGAMKDFHVEAIDVPNGQIKGYVEAPHPISAYTHLGGTPGWRLRESNWDPDFPTAFKDIEWFFVEGGVQPIDTMIATNLFPLQDFIQSNQGIYLSDYDLTLTADNFYKQIQQQTSYDFFPGSTQKRDFLGALGRKILIDVQSDPAKYAPDLIQIIKQNLSTKQIMITSKDPLFQSWVADKNWNGSLAPQPCQTENCLSDYIHINEANLGINKTNCCLDRSIGQEISIDEENQLVLHKLTINYVNHNPALPEPPDDWGGGYKVYLRLYLPLGSQLLGVTETDQAKAVQGLKQIDLDNFSTINFLGLVEGGQQGSYIVEYQVPYEVENPGHYQLKIQKQSGMDIIPWTINFQGDEELFQIDKDTVLEYQL